MNELKMRILPVVGFLVLVCTPVFSEEIPRGKPADYGLSAERLERIDAVMADAVAAGYAVGGRAVVARHGHVVYEHNFGMKDRETAELMSADTIFRIYSMTKPIAGVALLMLYEEGKFMLNDPVARYLPELADLKVAVATDDGDSNASDDSSDSEQAGKTREPARQPTIRDLMRHTAGFTYGIFGNSPVDKLYRDARLFQADNLAEFVKILGTLPLHYEPGSRWHYSVSVEVQSRLVEVLSGMSFAEFLNSRLFTPLDMRDTHFVLPADKHDRLAQLYSPRGSRAGRDGVWEMGDNRDLVVADPELSRGTLEGGVYEGGGSGLVSTSRDYLRFAQMLLNGGELDGVRILGPQTVKLMSSDHLGMLPPEHRLPGYGFGLGVSTITDLGAFGELGAEGAFGWGGAAGTRFWVDPEHRIIGILFLQSIPHRIDLWEKFRVLTYQALVE